MSTRLNKQRLMEMAGLICEAADYTFSGTDKFMDQVAVNVFKKHGIDQSQLNREYDANEGIVEFTVNLDDALVDKISQELEGADRGKGEYGGMMEGKEAARLNENKVTIDDREGGIIRAALGYLYNGGANKKIKITPQDSAILDKLLDKFDVYIADEDKSRGKKSGGHPWIPKGRHPWLPK